MAEPVSAMTATLTFPAALVAVLLAGCSGPTPSSPRNLGGPVCREAFEALVEPTLRGDFDARAKILADLPIECELLGRAWHRS